MTTEQLAYELAANALKRNMKFFEDIHVKKLEEIQKIEDKIDELLDMEKRRAKVEKLNEKLMKMKDDLAVFENLFAATKSAKQELEDVTGTGEQEE